MFVCQDGSTCFNDVFEMNYFLFLEMGLSLNQDNRLIDSENGTPIKFQDKYIKATVTPVALYGGKDDILFEPALNYKLMSTLLGYFIDKFSSDPDNEFNFVAMFIDNVTKDKNRIVIKYNNNKKITTNAYYNLYLCLIEAIFNINGNMKINLSNFDFPRDNK